ncbi:Rab18a [Monocercomonoides exilis]|uniref:Rab18a n=1 Tax=Monocercomonoides exilis TaxID=2049356 RepID=UPI00355ACB90|nr:Rab18a [Monocercomonoides exilis]|eukprot:MONOS_12338.1-p1 / transcript=MONOS_12338.1 / gene=MONOS_12338 / organism=Monocercomonoides_exilis_PA203 / gene_product=Rab18a / transcript_product=Rab18a / location=Mono_scaffold00678:7137-8286(-) / protein_length=228 / sequence_SO=supercontig / SO=protein_coding / is_pseudo=false
MDEECDYQVKIVVIGESQVGKSSLLLRFTEDTFDPNQPATIGVDFQAKDITFREKMVRITIWDTAGQERYRTLTSSYYRGATGIILVYDVTKRLTFENLDRWLKEAREHIGETDSVTMLVGNKADLPDRQISLEEGKDFARKRGMLFIEASAKETTGVEQAFMETIEKIFDQPTLAERCRIYRPAKSSTQVGSESSSTSSSSSPQVVDPSAQKNDTNDGGQGGLCGC